MLTARLFYGLLLTLTVALPANSALADTKELKVRSYRLAVWGQTQTDNNITAMNNMAAAANCADAKFKRDGPVEEFAPGLPDVLSSTDDMDDFDADGASVYVVRAITSCGSASGTIAGCARKGGPIVVTTYLPWSQLWIHEIGHAQDRRHNTSSGYIMYRALGPLHTRLTAAECTALKSPQLFPVAVEGETEAPQDEAIRPPIDELLSGLWEIGLSDPDVLADVQVLTPEDVAVAMKALGETDTSRWPNAVLIVGYHATPENREEIFSAFGRILATPSPEPSSAVEFAQRRVGEAIGFILRKENENTDQAATYLVDVARGASDESAGSPVAAPDAMTRSLICAGALYGLALGGDAFASQRSEASSFCETWLDESAAGEAVYVYSDEQQAADAKRADNAGTLDEFLLEGQQ